MRTVLVALLLALPSLLAGCTAERVDPTERFLDAEQRWSQRLEVPAEVRYDATLLEGPSVWRVSASSEAGFNVRMFLRGDLVDGNLGYQDWTFHVDELHWRTFSPQSSGEGTVAVECTGACAFTVARDPEGDLPAVHDPAARLGGARARFVGELDADFGSHDFEVPAGLSRVGFRASAHAPDDWFRMTITMSDGETFDFLRFPAVSMKNMQVSATAESLDLETFPAGTWNLLVDCEGNCSYAYGFYW